MLNEVTMVESESLMDCSTVRNEDGAADKRDSTPASPVRRPPGKTNSMPKRTIWKDKGGQARYVLGEEPKPEEAKPLGYGATAKEAVIDAVVNGSAAGLAVLDAVQNSRAAGLARRVERSLSQRRLKMQEDPCELPISARVSEPLARLAPQARGLLRRAKSLGAVRRGVAMPVMPQRSASPEPQAPSVVTTAA